MSRKNLIQCEKPIKSIDDDLLNFHPYAKKIKEVIQGYSYNPDPLIIGIYGKWGAGKTSLLNLIERHIELFQKEKDDKPYIKFHYNPWLYQSKEEMVFDFFQTLGSKLTYSEDSDLQKAAKSIIRYSRYLKSVKISASVGIPKLLNAGVSFEPYEIMQKLGEDLQGKKPNIYELKEDIDKQLLLSKKKIIIFIDDIDRLDKDEIYTLFKLVKINADFNNLVFVLCLDPNHVASAIYSRYGENEQSGKKFLEKIINIPIELPLIEKVDLDYFVKKKLAQILETKKIEKQRIEELYSSIDGALFDNPREVLRILNSFSISFFAIGDEVNLHDLFWIEFLKIKYPEVYNEIKNFGCNFKSNQQYKDYITFNDTFEDENLESGLRKKLKELSSKAFRIIEDLFPMQKNGTVSFSQNKPLKPIEILNSELRINHANHFEKYFSFHTKGKISEIKYNQFKSLLLSYKDNQAKSVLKEILEDVAERVVVYRLIENLEIQDDDENSIKLIEFLVQNLSLFTGETLYHHSNELLQSFAKKLRTNPEDNKKLIIFICESIDYIQLCWFIRSLNNKVEIKYESELNKILIDKIKKTDSLENPFYKNKNVAKMIMSIWSENSREEFEKYIIKSLNCKHNISEFFNCFPAIWNNNIIGVLKVDDYEFITKKLNLDSDKIISKIFESYPELKKYDLESLKNENWDEYTTNSGLDNTKQFLYWNLKNKNSN